MVVLVGTSRPSSEPETSFSSSEIQTMRDRPQIIVGGLYYAENDDGTFTVLKVLALDDFAVHLRSYANQFNDPPAGLDPSVLTLGNVDDPSGFGIGHFPVDREGFFNDNPVFIVQASLADDELEGYRLYLEAINESQ
jgi:hypothetical protein